MPSLSIYSSCLSVGNGYLLRAEEGGDVAGDAAAIVVQEGGAGRLSQVKPGGFDEAH